jgi:hypothetical protein
MGCKFADFWHTNPKGGTMRRDEDAIGIRNVYRDLVLSRSLRTIFRPDDLKYEQLYRPGEQAEVRIILLPGSERLQLPPQYAPERIPVIVEKLERIALKDLQASDFFHSSPDVQNAGQLAFHLGLIYNKPVSDYRPETMVIKITLRYQGETSI